MGRSWSAPTRPRDCSTPSTTRCCPSARRRAALDAGEWHALLRAAAGYHAYPPRASEHGYVPSEVAGFLLLNTAFPRSLTSAVATTSEALNSLRRDFNLTSGREAQRHLRSFQAELADLDIAQVLQDLHRWLDWAQLQLMGVSDAIGQDFFGWPKPAAAAISNHKSEKRGLRRFWWTTGLVQAKGLARWL